MSFIKRICADNRHGVRNQEEEYDCTGIEAALGAVRRLNGGSRTQVLFQGTDRDLIVGGGNDGRYSVYIAVGEDREFHTLIDPEKPADEEVEIVTGGQAGIFPGNQCVPLESALRAVRDFYDLGQPSPALKWVQSC